MKEILTALKVRDRYSLYSLAVAKKGWEWSERKASLHNCLRGSCEEPKIQAGIAESRDLVKMLANMVKVGAA